MNSMPNIGSHAQKLRDNPIEQSVIQRQSSTTSHVTLEVGSMVEVVSNSGIIVYGVVRWLGNPSGKTDEWAGIELVSEHNFAHLCFFSLSILVTLYLI